MRHNSPVTGHEYILRDEESIVSKTDLTSNITYINSDFIKISGFAEEELLGAPQNIIRHPDMPREAFADLWRTLKSGKAWTGMVKNRCKNGDHYWVEATAAPLIEHGQVTGYTSIRVKPTRSQVLAAEAAYQAVRNGDKAFHIHEGKVVKRSNVLKRFAPNSLLLRHKINAFAAVLAAIILYGLVCRFGIVTLFPNTTAVLDIAALVLLAAGIFVLHQQLLIPLEGATKDIDRMSANDLTGRIEATGNDEIAQVQHALRVLQTNIKLLVGQIKEATLVVHSGVTQVVAGNQDLSARTESQASALEETAASMEELTSTVKQNAANAKDANDLVKSAANTAQQGGKSVAQVIATMSSIKDSSRKIVDIISVIDGIAFQTNILALNAAVEAARAGEQGRGFAVVASEVRNLAQRSAGAAKEIKALIGHSVAEVDTGSALVDSAGLTMQAIVTSVSEVARYMSEITVASQEQSAGIEQINQAVVQMDNNTQQNAAAVEEAAASAERMLEQASHLTKLVNQFNLVELRSPRLTTPRKAKEQNPVVIGHTQVVQLPMAKNRR